jgi:drug/metabolite transporter (DMT)-like permease
MNITKGAQYLLLSTIFFTAMQALVKGMDQYDSFQHVFFRSSIGFLLCVIVLKKENISMIGKNQKMLIYRALVGCASMFSFFYILTKIPFGTASAFKYMSPIFATIFAALLLNEKIKGKQWVYFFMCFTGIILLKGFDVRIDYFDMIIGLISAISGGLLIIVIKKIGEDDHPLVILQYFMFIAAMISFIVILPYWEWPQLTDLIQIFAIGIIGFVAQYYFTKSIQQPDEVNYISILRYLEVFFALIIGYIWFDETYTWQSFFAITLIMLGILLSFFEKQNLKTV